MLLVTLSRVCVAATSHAPEPPHLFVTQTCMQNPSVEPSYHQHQNAMAVCSLARDRGAVTCWRRPQRTTQPVTTPLPWSSKHVRCSSRRPLLTVALSRRELEEAEAEEASSSTSFELELPLPAQYYQRKLNIKEIKELRTTSNTMAKEDTIMRITCGQKGITQTFLNACADALCKHGFLRVKLGEGSDLERKEAAQALEKYLDAVAVHQIGFTITLHRQLGLPRPSNCPEALSTPSPSLTPESDPADKLVDAAASGKVRVPRKRASAKSAERAAAAKAAAKRQPKGPPEFSVVK